MTALLLIREKTSVLHLRNESRMIQKEAYKQTYYTSFLQSGKADKTKLSNKVFNYQLQLAIYCVK